MTTLQTGTKVLIEATVHEVYSNRVNATTKNNMLLTVHPSDLTVCETAKPVATPSFKAGQEEIEIGQTYFNPFGQKCRVVVFDGEDKVNHPYVCFNEFNNCYEGWVASQLRPIPAQPTVESELTAILNDHIIDACCDIETGVNRHFRLTGSKIDLYKDITAWHQKHSGRVEVSVPSDEEISDYYRQCLNNFPYNKQVYSVTATVKHFMTRKEAGNG